MKQITALVVDDEANSRAILQNYLKKYCPQVQVLGEAGSVTETLELLKNHEPDMVFWM